VDLGYRADIVDIRPCGALLHLKTGIAWLGDGRVLATADVPRFPELAAYEILRVPDAERYAANALRVNDRVLVAAGYPATRAAVESLGFAVIEVEMSEFRKLDGGLSCLSLRWQ
jgi:dimethylargininase